MVGWIFCHSDYKRQSSETVTCNKESDIVSTVIPVHDSESREK